MSEEWREVVDFPEYQVSNLGRVKKGEKVLSQFKRGQYYAVGFNKNKISYTKSVHRLVAEAFLENPDNKPSVDHINRDKSDNRLENLAWKTAQEQALNRNIGYRGSNTREKNISYLKRDKVFQVIVTRNYEKSRSTFKTLEEAIVYRDSLI